MKVLHVINGLGTGGAERSLAEMLPLLVDHGVEPAVVCLYRRHEGVEQSVVDAGIPVRFIDSSSLPARVAELRRMLKGERPDLVHTAIFESDLVGRFAGAGTGIPVLTSLVNTSYDPARLQDPNVSARKLAAVRMVDAWTARHLTAHFHAITHAVKDAAVRDLGVDSGRITVIERGRDSLRLGAPSEPRRRRSREALGLREDDVVVVTAGRQEYQKGQVHLIDAVRFLLGEHPRLVLLVAGRTGHATPQLQRSSADLVEAGRVRFLGHRNHLPDVLAAADVFAFPSLFEGLGGAVIEAMALGLPVVASDIPALREVLEQDGNAELVAPGSADALACALDGLLTDRARLGNFGLRSRRIFEERFTLECSITRMVELYEGVLDHEPVPHGR